MLKDADSTIQAFKDQTMNNLPMTLYQEYMTKFTPAQRQVLFVSGFRLAAIALLTWGLWSNLCTAFTVSLSWAKASSVPLSLENSKGLVPFCKLMWSNNSDAFLRTYSVMRMVLDPLFLLIQGAATVFTVARYERFVGRIEQRMPNMIKETSPLLTRALSLLVAFAWNTSVSLALSTLGIGFGTFVGWSRTKLR